MFCQQLIISSKQQHESGGTNAASFNHHKMVSQEEISGSERVFQAFLTLEALHLLRSLIFDIKVMN